MQCRSDEFYMQNALAIARQGLGRTAPNPSVGCVVVRDGVIVGRACTAVGGRPHAEKIALEQAGDFARGAVAYVTLEPCCFEGKSGACTQALIEAGVAKVVIAVCDPHPKVSGHGVAVLHEAGIEVVVGVCEEDALALNKGFFLLQEQQRPLVTVKLATSKDGVIARPQGQSQWITGKEARYHGHLLRYNHDAILVGSSTVVADDPQLTCRLSGAEDASPLRIVLDKRGRVEQDAAIIQTAGSFETWIVGGAERNFPHVTFIDCDPHDITSLLSVLAGKGVTRLLVEGGAEVVRSFFEAGCVDQCYWYQSKEMIGDGGVKVELAEWLGDAGLVEKWCRKVGEDELRGFEG